MYDIVLVLHNSEHWLPACIDSLAKVEYDLSQVNIIAVDNASKDDSVALYKRIMEADPPFGSFQLIENRKNVGFGPACNQGADAGESGWIFFLNIDTEVDPEVLVELDIAVASHPDAGAFECRQLPREMGHHVDPVSLKTPWASGAALVVKRTVFAEVGGFDKHLFMYCEDIDLSWRIRASGKFIYYLPRAVVKHFVLERENPQASELREYAYSYYSNLLLTYKYGRIRDIFKANKQYWREMRKPKHFDGVRKLFAKNYIRHLGKFWPFLFWRSGFRSQFENAPAILMAPPAPDRGTEILNRRFRYGPLVSIVIRTHSRPQVLRGALTSIANQTYRNFEVVVVEDGQETSRKMIEQEFQHLPLVYYATGQNVGRGKVGNIGLSLARGEYLNFLDDDDYFYPDHLELMMEKAQRYPDAELILGCAMAMKIEVESKDPYFYEIKSMDRMLFDRVDVFTMSQTCQIPIQSAVFKRSLYERHGGLREDIDANEDWTMWMHFLRDAKRINPKHIDIHRATSIFVLPANPKMEEARIESYRSYYRTFYEDPTLHYDVSLADMRYYFDSMIADMRHLQNIGRLDEYLQQQAERDKDIE